MYTIHIIYIYVCNLYNICICIYYDISRISCVGGRSPYALRRPGPKGYSLVSSDLRRRWESCDAGSIKEADSLLDCPCRSKQDLSELE